MIELPGDKSTTDVVTAWQARCNRSTQRQWGMYAAHRQAIERLIVPAARGGSICVLGAGNCNDLDLAWLTDVYAEVHLVDIDADALNAGVARQLKSAPAGLRMHAPFDLTGVAARVAGWSKAPPGAAEIDAAARAVLGLFDLPWPACDTVLSPCVLTQTINPTRDALREHHPRSHPSVQGLRAALRSRHLRTIAKALKPGGRGVLAIDIVSSEKLAELPRLPEDEFEGVMRRFIADGKSYRGLDPASIAQAVRGDPAVARLVDVPRFTAPWRWHLGLHRSFLVYAATFNRRGV